MLVDKFLQIDCRGYQMRRFAKYGFVSDRSALLAIAVVALSSCSEKPAEEAAEQASYSGPNLSASAAPDVAFSYDYAFSLPNPSVAAIQEQHAAACEKLGPASCRITGMRYNLVRGGDIDGSLSVRLDRNIARGFGRDAVASTEKLGGKLTSAYIEGQDMASQIAASKSISTSSSDRIVDLEKQLARTDLKDRERAELRAQLEALRSERDGSRASQVMAQAQVALTPLTLHYAGSGALALSDNPFTSAGGAFVASATTVLSLLLFGLAYGLPWIVLALAAVLAWRTPLMLKLRAVFQPAETNA